jgi:2,4-dienoyl-CoA reductase-like NADH-dependent reductase (Old Yellow Enzyme family)/thioredoxin reductase
MTSPKTPYPALFKPFNLKGLVLKNRIMSTGHEPAYAVNGRPELDYQRYHEEKAKGGIALTIFGGSANIAADSHPTFGQLYVGDDGIIPYFQDFAERIHRHGTALFCQLTHMGRRTTWNAGPWLVPVSPSPIREHAHRSFPKTIERSDISRIVQNFADAAGRCDEGGLDGCELLSYGHLIGQFLSPLVNQRTDSYGGNLENRARFGLEVLEALRERTSQKFVVGLRMSVDERVEGGYGEDEGIRLAAMFANSGLVDYLTINVGQISTYAGSAASVPGMAYPSAVYLETAGRVRRAVTVPVFHACKIADLPTAEFAIKSGHLDMVGMVRAHLADPYIVAKLQRGEEERIRPCVGAGYCIDRIYQGHRGLCIHNPATGRELTMPHVIARSAHPDKKIVVVGAGPAGLEAARVCAERGHRVTLFEAASELGGQVCVAARASWRKNLIGVVDWRVSEITHLSVDVRQNTYAEVGDILSESPDVVIIATGGVPNTGHVPGGELAISTWDVLSGNVPVGEEVLVYDNHGQHQAASAAEYLAARGANVELLTPDRAVMHELGNSNFAVHLRNLYEAGVSFTPDHRLSEVSASDNRLVAHLTNEYTDRSSERVVDQVVIEHGTLPMDELYFDLQSDSTNLGEFDIDAVAAGLPALVERNPQGRFALLRVGDAVASRNIHAAIFDSLRLCKDL